MINRETVNGVAVDSPRSKTLSIGKMDHARAEPNVDQARVHSIIGKVHLVNTWDGSMGRRFVCERCKRNLQESMFAPLGPRFLKTGKSLMALHANCHTCRKQLRGKWVKHPAYSIEIDTHFREYMPGLRAGAGGRSIFFGIDKDDILGCYIEQEGRCALSGLPFKFDGSGGKGKNGRSLSLPSLDRIDSRKHYTPDNIQLVLAAVNIMKGELGQDEFVQLCREIAVHKMVF